MNNILNTSISLTDLLNMAASKQIKKDMDIDNAITLFLKTRKNFNREGTYLYYIQKLNEFKEYFKNKNINTINQIDQEVINNLVLHFKLKGNKPTTINKKLIALNTMINFLNENNFVDSPKYKFTKLKEQIPKIQIVNFQDLEKILNYIKNLCPKSQLIVLLLITTGIRTSELIHIENKNIIFEQNSIYLTFTKNGNPRYCYFDDDIKEIILKVYDTNNKYLFALNPDNHVNADCVRSILARSKKALNIEILSAHKLRHLYATTLLKNGADIKTVKQLLGHSKIEMTMRYIDYTEEELKQSSFNLNPLKILKNN